MPSLSRVLFVATAFLTVTALRAEDWPMWRGPGGMGQSTARGVPTVWGGKDQKNVVWKTPLYENEKVKKDQNQSSPIVVGERVFVTLSYWPVGSTDKDFPEHHVLCFSAIDGKKQWDTKVEPGPSILKDLRGGYTAPTPASDGKTVVVVFGSSVIAALDLDGKLRWRKEIVPNFFDVAVGTSPIIHKDLALYLCDQMKSKKTSCLLAYDLATGEVKLKTERPDDDYTHSTPALTNVAGKPQLLVAGAAGPQGLDPDTGKKLWWFKSGQRLGDTVTPIYADGVVYLDSGRGGPGVAVDPTQTNEIPAANVKWKLPNVPEGFSSPVAVGKLMFRSVNPSLVTCRDLEDGKEIFKERYEGLETALSPIATADGLLYFAGGGKSYVLKADRTPTVVSVNDLGDPGKASPAIAGSRLYIKGFRNLYCIGDKK
jgi:outer membrane protein assembly factor BamB